MNKRIVTAIAATAAAALVPLTVTQVGAAGAAGLKHQQGQTGAITIESWLYAVPSENVLSGTVWDCFRITGAISDQGGGPTWTAGPSYHAPNTMTSGGIAAATHECANKVPAGGFVLVPPPEAGQYQFAQYTAAPGSPGGLSTLYAVHTIAGQKGDIYITFAGTYNMTNSVSSRQGFKRLDGRCPTIDNRPPVHVADNRRYRRLRRLAGKRDVLRQCREHVPVDQPH